MEAIPIGTDGIGYWHIQGNYCEDELVLDGEILTYFLTAHTEFRKKQDRYDFIHFFMM